MKARLLLLIVPLLAACTPQRQLGRLLARHPELRAATDTIVVRDSVLVPGAYAHTFIPDSVLQHHISTHRPQADAQGSLPTSNNGTSQTNRVGTVEAGNAGASLTSDPAAGGFWLAATQKPDTIRLEVPVEVPVYEYLPVEADIPQWVVMLSTVGGIAIAIVALMAVLYLIRIVRKFI
ncbi:MAG: hypothetical protein ACI30H_02630 [Paludibacteraceae bacterium]